jgi:hypothetical protein
VKEASGETEREEQEVIVGAVAALLLVAIFWTAGLTTSTPL